MTAGPTVRAGVVEWTGDNPFIYLSADGTTANWAALALFFRVVASPHGGGFMALIVESPYQPDATDACRVCLTDNDALADVLMEDFVSGFPLFRPVELSQVRRVSGATCRTDSDGRTWWTTYVNSDTAGLAAELSWSGVLDPFAVVVGPDDSPTRAHEMLSVFAVATSASIVVNGRRLPGEIVERDFFGGRAQSAALAFSETWISPESARARR